MIARDAGYRGRWPMISMALEFQRTMAEWLDHDTLVEIDTTNAIRDDQTCASHDHCDPNVAMWDAFVTVYDREPDLAMDGWNADISIMNAAWTIAKANGFALKGKK